MSVNTPFLLSQPSEIMTIARMLMKPYRVPKLLEISTSFDVTVCDRIIVTDCRKQVLISSGKRNAYIIFPVWCRSSDLAKNFQLKGPIISNVSTMQLVIDRQITASTDELETYSIIKNMLNSALIDDLYDVVWSFNHTSLGQEWLPVAALPYAVKSVWVKLIDENGPATGNLEYDGCLLPDDERKEIGRTAMLVDTYNLIISGGQPVNDNEMFLRSKFDYVTDEIFSIAFLEFLGSIELSNPTGVFDRLGNAFRNVIVTVTAKSRVQLIANNLVFLETVVEPNIRTNITKDVTLPYPPYNEIRYEITNLHTNTKDVECTVERDECVSSVSLDKNIFLVPSMGLIMKGGVFGFCP